MSIDLETIKEENEEYGDMDGIEIVNSIEEDAARPTIAREQTSIKPKYENDFESQLNDINFDPISIRDNFCGNYDNYIKISLFHLKNLQNINYENALNKKKKYDLNKNADDQNHKKLLLLDLDETLVHADFDEQYKEQNDKDHLYDTIVKFISLEKISDTCEGLRKNSNLIEVPHEVGIFLRPNVKEFLTEISKYYDLGIFTASVKEYADAVINYLDPESSKIKYRLYRESCIEIKDICKVKDLRIFNNIDLKNVILVDNSMYSFAPQISNGVLINSFFGDKNDSELVGVFNYLMNYLFPANDVRVVNEQTFEFKKIMNDVNIDSNEVQNYQVN